MNFKDRIDSNRGKALHGYLLGMFPGRRYPQPYRTMNLLKLDWIERFYFIIGFNAGCFEKNKKILTGEFIKIGGIWGPIPEGTIAEDWKGSEEIVKTMRTMKSE